MAGPAPEPALGTIGSPPSKRSAAVDNLCVSAYSLSFLVFGLQVALLGPTSSEVAQSLGVAEADLGIVYSINGLMSIIGAIPSGWAIDKLPGHMVLAVSLALEALGFYLLPRCSSLTSLTLTYALVAFTWNFLTTAGNTFVLWISREQKGGGMLINLVNALFGAGSLAAPLMVELAVQLTGRGIAAYWLTAALTATSAATFLLLPSPTKPVNTSEATEGTSNNSNSYGSSLEIAEAAAAADGEAGPAGETEAPSSGSDGRPAVRWDDGGPLTALLAAMGIFVWISVGMEVAFGNWIFTYSLKQLGLGERQAHLLNAAYWGAFTAGRLLASAAALLVSPLTVLLASMPLAVVGSGVAVVLPPPVLAGQEGWVMAGVAVLVGLGVSTAFANALAILDDAAPITGMVTGVVGALAGAGCMVFPLMVALVAKYSVLGYQGLMWATLLGFVALFVCLAAGLKARRRVKQMQDQRMKSVASIHVHIDGRGEPSAAGSHHHQQQQQGAPDQVPLLHAEFPVG